MGSLLPLSVWGEKPEHQGPTCRLLLPGDDDGRPGGLSVLLQGHVQAEQVLGVLPYKPTGKRHTRR